MLCRGRGQLAHGQGVPLAVRHRHGQVAGGLRAIRGKNYIQLPACLVILQGVQGLPVLEQPRQGGQARPIRLAQLCRLGVIHVDEPVKGLERILIGVGRRGHPILQVRLTGDGFAGGQVNGDLRQHPNRIGGDLHGIVSDVENLRRRSRKGVPVDLVLEEPQNHFLRALGQAVEKGGVGDGLRLLGRAVRFAEATLAALFPASPQRGAIL